MNVFTEIANRDREHLRSVGRQKGFVPPPLSNRAEDLKFAMVPLHAVKPVLTGRYLVKGWLDRNKMSVVYGESNVGKTFFALDLALHVAARLPWHGHKVAGQDSGSEWDGPVIYIAAEGGNGLLNRIEAVKQCNTELFERAAPDGDFCLLPTALDLHGSNDGDALADAILDSTDFAGLIVVDTLARTMGEGDENAAKDMGQFVRNLDVLRERTGAHIMVIHHSGKDTTKGARGSGSLRGAVDTEIELTRSGAVIMAEARKQRDMPCDKVFAYTLRSVVIGQDEDAEDVSSAVLEPAEPVKKVARLSGQQKIAMQALDDALAHHGEKKHGDMFPTNRRCVSLDHWREYCDRHSLSGGEGDSSKRTAFHKAKTALHNKELIRVVDDFVWRCSE